MHVGPLMDFQITILQMITTMRSMVCDTQCRAQDLGLLLKGEGHA